MTKFIIKPLSLVLCVSLLFVSCTSPAKKGKRFAEKENRICENCQKELDKLIKSFTVDFNPDKYTRRQEAKEDWMSRYLEISKQFDNDLSNIKDDMNVEISDMDIKDMLSFRESYNSNRKAAMQDELWRRLYDSTPTEEVLRSIARINPPKPDISQMKEDLDKRMLSDVEGGYYYEIGRLIKIEEYDISDLKIVDVITDNATEYIVKVSMTLWGKANRDRRFDVQCKIRYLLPQYDDWSIDFIKTEKLSPVNSAEYKECVKLNLYGGWLGKDLYVKNDCDKALEVFIRYYNYGQWSKAVVVAKAQDNTRVSYSDPDEYIIDFVMPL